MNRRRSVPALILGLGLVAWPGLAQEADPATPAPSGDDTPAAADPAVPARLTRAQGRLFIDRRTDVVGATVRVESQDRRGEVFLTASDEDGVFRVDGLQDGQYRLRIHREGLKPIRKDDVTVKFPFRAVVELPMEPGDDASASLPSDGGSDAGPVRVVGQVMVPDGDPLAETRVRLVRPDGSDEPRLAVSDQDGRFEIGPLPAGDWQLTARAVGMLTLRDRLRLDGNASLRIAMVRQPADYDPSPLDLMPEETPIVPASLLESPRPVGEDAEPTPEAAGVAGAAEPADG